jgi:hypothetical protein
MSKAKSRIVIEAVVLDPPIVHPGETATITIHAHDSHGGPLDYEVSASEGTVERTDEPNVFLWHVPETLTTRQGVRIH